MKKQEENQRKYFRISDTVGLGFQPVSSSVATDPSVNPEDPVSTRFRILSELHRIELESRYILRVISDKDRNVADYLRTIDRRIDLLGQLCTQGNGGGPADLPRHEVNLSEGGIEFDTATRLEIGSFVALRLVLLPTRTALLLFGRIIHSEQRPGSNPEEYVTGAEFVRQSEADRQILARHILQLQLAQRRKRANKGVEPIS